MSHSRQTVFRLFSCSQSADWCFHSHLDTTAAIVGACLWVCEHVHVCTISKSSHWNGTLARPTSIFFFFFFLVKWKTCRWWWLMSTTPTHEAFTWISPFKHACVYIFMYIYTFTLDTFSLFLWNSLKQQKQKICRHVSRSRETEVFFYGCVHALTVS